MSIYLNNFILQGALGQYFAVVKRVTTTDRFENKNKISS
jgi:hypothetical protein